jgi:uncharacterized repeat protein (TIGR03803 family)
MMMDTTRHRGLISRIRLGAASAALTLAVVLGLGVVTTQSARAQTFKVLHYFGNARDGTFPHTSLVPDRAGNLYGTTTAGGVNGYGTVFEVNPTTGRYSVLYSFKGAKTDGAYPTGSVAFDAAGSLYGTTFYGGSGQCNDGNGVGCGTVFKLTSHGANWTESVLYNFMGQPDGAYPHGGVVADAAGDLYGTTDTGGASNFGAVFERNGTTGGVVTLYSFKGGDGDGAFPEDGLVFDAAGNLWGTTFAGGTFGNGTVFKLYPCYQNCSRETLKHVFGEPPDGTNPRAGLVENAGTVWGTTTAGGANGSGTVFERSGAFYNVLYSFRGSPDGAAPWGGLVQGRAHALYGTTYYGGTNNNNGTVFVLKPAGETVLHSFAGSDGANPYGGLFLDAKGVVYGTASEGGSFNAGTLWRLLP